MLDFSSHVNQCSKSYQEHIHIFPFKMEQFGYLSSILYWLLVLGGKEVTIFEVCKAWVDRTHLFPLVEEKGLRWRVVKSWLEGLNWSSGMNVSQGKFRLHIRKIFLTRRSITTWNGPPREMVEAD